MAYIAVKPCRLAGQSFKIGETIPAEYFQPGAAKNLVKMGVVVEEGTETTAPTIKTPNATTITIHTAEGDLPLDITPEGIQAVFDALTSNAEDAEAIVEAMTEDDALILLNASDKRKTIQKATEERAKALSGPQEGEKTEGEE